MQSHLAYWRPAGPNGTLFIDPLASLHLVLGNEANAAGQEVRLYAEVVEAADALT